MARIASAVDGEAALLDFSARTLTNAAHVLRARGYGSATVVPLLFTDAYHLNTDVPAAVADAAEETGLDLRIAAGLGTGEELAGVLHEAYGALVAAHPERRSAGVILYAVGSSTPGANAAVERLAREVGRRAGVPGQAVFATGAGPKGVPALNAAVGTLLAAPDSPPPGATPPTSASPAASTTPAGMSRDGATATPPFTGATPAASAASATTAAVAVLPLFVAEGVLWDAVLRAHHEGQLPHCLVGTPLAERVAPIVRARVAHARMPGPLATT